MNYDDMILVIQAAKAGKAIQCKRFGAWYDTPAPPVFDMPLHCYRVKPEPLKALHTIKGIPAVVIWNGRPCAAVCYGDWRVVFSNEGTLDFKHKNTLPDATREQCLEAGYEWPLADKSSEARRYTHDCDGCTFLGRWQEYDLYHCKHGRGKLTARWGNAAEEVTDKMTSTAHDPVTSPPACQEALKRAIERGLAKPTTEAQPTTLEGR